MSGRIRRLVAVAFATAAVGGVLAAPAAAVGGPKGAENYGQCKAEWNEKVCKKFHTGS
jgi:hypothetical protein